MNSLSWWPALLFWPAVAIGLLAATLGLVWRRASLLVAAAVLVLPAALYLTATPRLRYVGLFPVAFQLIAAQAVRRDRVWIGTFLVAVVAAFFGWLAWLVAASY